MSDTPRSVASNFLQALLAQGIDQVFANAGTDFAPVIEALVHARRASLPTPRFLIVPHENVAISMAHGYFLATGKPAAVMVHVTVGTANALCGLMNAARDQAPILLMAGRTPSSETGHIGSRNASIHWGQDSFDQGGIVREWVKWDYELRVGQAPEDIVGRALDIAMSEPKGPVYLCMPREVLGDPVAAPPQPPRTRALGALPATPNAAAIEQAAAWLTEAEFPLIISSSSGRDPANVERLANIAQRYGIGVALPGEPGARELNIPTTHPLFLGVHPAQAIARADVVVALDCEVPWWPSQVSPRPDAKLIHISADPFFSRYPVRGFAMDLAIAGSSSQALVQLEAALAKACAGQQTRIDARTTQLRAVGAARREAFATLVRDVAAQPVIHPAWVAACINEIADANTVIVNEMGVPLEWLDLQTPRSYLSSSLAGGLGFGLGAALGVKSGAPDKQVLLLVGDGSYMFGCPTAAHHAARLHGLPTTVLVMNNACWNAVHRSTLGMYPEGLAAQEEEMPLVSLGTSPEYQDIMRACGGHGEKVAAPAQLPEALQRCLAANREGKSALLNIVCSA
ncbi:MAG TPA: thiamine pyrophosphate-requiring protein [Hyphomicrobiales bacterium]|nr:thiamine pyrophosphate-requiring protein [Hyphomicrobiales bacterium]